MMDKTRFQIMGGVFLMAVLVIVLPMVFDGKGIPRTELAPMPEPHDITTPEVTPARLDPATPLINKVEQLKSAVDPDGFRTDNGTRFGEPVLTEVRQDTDVFAVQIASFAELANAHEFRARLRNDGFEAFVSTIRLATGNVTRVAVGPFLDVDAAQDLRVKLTKKYELQARVMAFSS